MSDRAFLPGGAVAALLAVEPKTLANWRARGRPCAVVQGGALDADEERRPAGVLLADPVSEALAGERAALRVLRRIADRIGTGDELLGELRDVVLDDGGNVPATPRLRAFLRAIQKRIEGRS